MQDVNLSGSGMGRSNGQWLRVAVLLVLAVGLAVVLFAAWQLRDRLEPLALTLGALFAACGLLAVLAWIAGMLQFAGTTAERPFFDAVADAMGDAAVVTDAKGRAVYANAAFLKLASSAGASRLVGMDVLFAGYPDFAEPVYQLAQASQKGAALQRDVRAAAGSSVPGAKPDSSRWLRLAVSPLAGAGHSGYSLWRLIDITADRQHQESAFSRLQFIITYLDHAPMGFFSSLPNGKVDYINATLAEWLGLDLVEAQAGTLTLSDVTGADTAGLLTGLEPVVDGFRTERFAVSMMSRKVGRFAAEILHRADFDRDGKALPSRSMVLKRDGDDRLADGSPAFVSQVWGAALPIGFAQIDRTSEIQMANGVFLSLSPKLKLKGKLQQAFAKGKAGLLEEAVSAAFAEPGKRVELDAVFDLPEPRAIKLYLLKMQSDDEKLSVFAEDLTESKALEVQLAQSQKMQAVGQLASGIAHDFNNVLTPIIGFADLLLAKMRPTDSAFNDVMNIKQNANRAANLVRQLLAFSRKQTMQPKLHALTEAMSDLGNLLGRVLGEKIELDINHGRDLGLVMVDIHQFEQVIINLAVNARDAMPQGGKLSVRTYNMGPEQLKDVKHALPSAEYVVCDVTDSGTGIPAEIVDKIWEPFFSTKDVGKGTGLGLSMVYGIIKQTGGFIFCESTIGHGTTFRIFLPRHYPDKNAIAAAAVVKEEAARPKREDFTGRGRILVVEDEDSVRAFAVRALQSRGYTVVEAESGEVGLQTIDDDKEGFELILSDVVMPEMDGPTMLAEIRKRGNTTKFIFMSGYAEDAFERNLENPNDFGFLQKPFSLKQLLEKVKDSLG
jgi:two-component system, cell cycle sensor histidine kinase and response regulator CckA